MYPEDRVLVGVINRPRDLAYARDEHWYRIPQARFSRGVNTEYLAFFLSRGFKERNGGIYYYARKTGLELLYRRDLLPNEAGHKRANETYYKVGLGELVERTPPILNPTRRSISFIYTTWDRFVSAQKISDLYSPADYFVDRIYHALRNVGLEPDRLWEAERKETGHAAGLRILCEKGVVAASTEPGQGALYLRESDKNDAILTTIRAEIAKQGGPVMVHIPLEGS